MKLNSQDLSWCARRLPRDLANLLKEHAGMVFIAGGYIRSRITNEPVNDIDLFAPSKEVARLVADKYAGYDSARVYETDNAFTIKATRPTVQVIHRWTFGSPEECLKSFDSTIACAAFWWNGERWDSACHENYYPDLAGRRLVYLRPQRNEDAGGSILRVLKFYQRGYRIPLDSLGHVIARLVSGVRHDVLAMKDEGETGRVLSGLLREVDPNLDPDHSAHLPSSSADDITEGEE